MTTAEVRAFDPLVRACARKFTPASLPASIDMDDLVSVAWQALLEAESSFDGRGGTPFEAWAWLKMRGAVKDEIRKHRAGTKRLAADEPVSFEDRGDSGRTTDESAEQSMDVRGLVVAIASLPENERKALVGRLNGRLGADIGEELGVTRSRVSQLTSAAIGRLRNEVAA